MTGIAYNRRHTIAWMLYDWANSAFATVVLVGFFPIFFKNVLAANMEATVSSFYLGLANSLSGFAVIILAPVIGAIADHINGHKRFLWVFALVGIAGTCGLFFVQADAWVLGLAFFFLSSVGFMASLVFYDAMLVTIVSPRYYERVSAGGFAFGYLGGGLIFAICILMSLYPQQFGMESGLQAVRWSFLLAALWWALFSIPVLLIPAPAQTARFRIGLIKVAFHALWDTFSHVRARPVVFKFLLAYWLYIDGVDTIIRMATDYGLSVGIAGNDLIVALLITQFVGFPATLLYGRLAEKIGPKSGIVLALMVYMVICVYAYFMDSAAEFYILAGVVGLVQGGVQALSRSMYAALVPPARSAEFFGFYNMLGKTAVLLGPVLMGGISALTGNPRFSIFAVVILLALGMWLLLTIRVTAQSSSTS
jgi:UMF1 family MFS transporter